jgi:hypothetical protein
MSQQLVRVERDPQTGIIEQFWYDHDTDKVTIVKTHDVEAIMKMVQEMHNQHTRPNYSDSNGQHLVARIPIVVIDLWREQGFDWFQSTDKERRAWLDKEENAVFKTRPGKLNGVTKSRLTSKAS